MKQIFFCSLLLFYLLPCNLTAHVVESPSDSGEFNKGTLYKALAFTGAYYTTSIIVMNNTWYKDKERVPFHLYNDNAGYLQVDKFGHMFGGYVYSYISYFGLLQLGCHPKRGTYFWLNVGICFAISD